MKLPFKFKDIHSCEAVVLTCIDFRFWRETLEYIEKELNIKSFDFPSLPGAAKAINGCADNDIAMQCVSVPCDLHHAKKLVIVNHQDCGAYGGSKMFNGDEAVEQKFHEEELKKAKIKILKKYSNLEVILVYTKLTDEGENIEFLTVDYK
jgi:carbonic anhydrase